MGSILLLGLLIGMQHALEADHVAAVASIAARQSSLRRIVTHGAVWGLGHTLTLMLFAGAAILLGVGIGTEFANWLECAVGVTLILLGGHLIFGLWRDRVHFHSHRHAGGLVHFHAHSHRGEPEEATGQAHRDRAHDHGHPRGLPVRTLLVGMMHGMAGSAALLILTASTVTDPWLGMAYVAVFGLGSIAGMVALSVVIALPLGYTAQALTWANRSIQGLIGLGTTALGATIVAGFALG